MKRSQHPRWLALLLAGAVWTGSVGITSFAAEADSIVSADISVEETETEQDAAEDTEEAIQNETADEAVTSAEASEEETEENTEKATDAGSTEPAVAADAATDETAAPEEETENADADGTASGEAASQEEAEQEVSGTENETEIETEESVEEAADTEAEVSETAEEESGTVSAEAASEETEDALTDLSVTFDKTGSIVLSEGGKTTLTAQISFTADSAETAEAVEKSVSWTSSSSKVAGITAGTPVITKNAVSATATDDEADVTEAAATAVEVTISQSVTVTAVSEGTAVIEVEAGGESCTAVVTVNPVPVALGKSANLKWTNTTVLNWDAVKNAGQYKVMVYLWNGTKNYSKSVTVAGRTTYDLEDCIVALVKSKKSVIKGAAYRISASVQALSTNTRYFTDGAAVASPDMRYLQTTYKDAVSRNGWYLRGGYWYYYETGKKQTGWIAFQNNKYYLDAEGRMLHDCWVGNSYLKTGGEMAVSQWVDGYKYYVNEKGVRVDDMAFSTKKWVKTSKGWRFKKKDGKYARSMWIKVNGTKYYFDAKGYLATGWVTVKGKKYFLKKSGDITEGLGIPRTGWSKIGKYYYWFDADGVMAKSQWVDRNQFYVNAKGHRLSWITYENLKNVNTSNRLGQYVYDKGSAPEQSIAGYDAAYKSGNRILVIDLRFTKDGVPVCAHDDMVKYARYTDGRTPGTKPSVSGLTLKELNKYDYGIYRGTKYKGTKILTLDAMAKWIKSHPDTELYIEVKTDKMTSKQIKKTAAILKKYGVTARSSAIFSVNKASDTRAKRMHKAAPTLRIGITTASIGTLAYSQLKSARGNSNEVFLWCWTSTKLSSTIVSRLQKLNAQFECGTMDEFDDIIKYYSKGSVYTYNTGIETDGAVFQNLLKEATCHSKAKWESTKKGWMYRLIDQTYVKNKWMQISGKYYHFDKNGLMQTGWLTLGNKLYYLDAKGARVTGTVKIAKHTYLFDENGVMVKKIK